MTSAQGYITHIEVGRFDETEKEYCLFTVEDPKDERKSQWSTDGQAKTALLVAAATTHALVQVRGEPEEGVQRVVLHDVALPL